MVVVGLNFKDGGKVSYYVSEDEQVKIGDSAIIRTDSGLEYMRVVKVRPYTDDDIVLSHIVRVATKEDHDKRERLYSKYDEVFSCAKKLILKSKLKMKLVDVEFPFEGNKIIINFICDERVDFRELVKELASTLHSRIELRQIGVRDQAKTIGALGVCGQECCCKKYLSDFDKVSIKMAKVQNLSLNPTKISGMCGRLMCCLGYENDTYIELASKMPKINSVVRTPNGEGTVMYNNILSGIVTVKIKDGDNYKFVDVQLQDIKQG